MKELEGAIINLDCTLRDGGYYTNWFFPEELVKEYFEALSFAGVDVVEVGYRSNCKDGFKGPYAYSSEYFLRSLSIPSDLKIAIMIDAKELLENDLPSNSVNSLLPLSSDNSIIKIIRIACRLDQISHLKQHLDLIYEKGYQLCLNIMQASELDKNKIENLAKEVSRLPIKVLYLADSTGSMYPKDINFVFEKISKLTNLNFGFHAHDNLELANFNSLNAIEAGVKWIDSTVYGIGRGPGNAKTEFLMTAIKEKYDKKKIKINKLLLLLNKYFYDLKNKYNWGSNTYYQLTGLKSIHPSYVQNLLTKKKENPVEFLHLIDFLESQNLINFKVNIIEQVKYFYKSKPRGNWDPKDVFHSKNVLLIGTGPSSIEYKKYIEEFINIYNPIVVALNLNNSIKEKLINYRVVSNPVRMMTDSNNYSKAKQPIISPKSMLKDELSYILDSSDILDYGFEVKEGIFEHKSNNYSIIPCHLGLAYALAVINSGGANQIFLVGFDGYPNDRTKNEVSLGIFNLYKSYENFAKLICLTHSLYNLPSRSIFSYL